MKNSIGKNVKKIAAGLLAGALVLTGVSYLPGNSQKAYAAETVDESVIHTEYFENITKYVGGEKRIAPKPQETGYEEWVFAGWYKNADCSKAVAIDSTVKAGGYYAKFVPAGVLSVKCQTVAGTVAETEKSQLRLVSTVDNLQYNEVGFKIIVNGMDRSYSSKKVCSEIKVTDDTNSKVTFNAKPQDFHSMARYFTTVTFTNIAKDFFGEGFFITPYWETMDGTIVYGVSRYARVEDSYLNIVNVPVRLYSDVQVAAGYLEVGYDETKFTYVGYDMGTVFEEMEATPAGADVVRLVGNVEDIKSNVAADGMYANLRFKKIEGVSLGGAETFAVSGEQFCDNLEKLQEGMDVFDIVYKNLNY